MKHVLLVHTVRKDHHFILNVVMMRFFIVQKAQHYQNDMSKHFNFQVIALKAKSMSIRNMKSFHCLERGVMAYVSVDRIALDLFTGRVIQTFLLEHYFIENLLMVILFEVIPSIVYFYLLFAEIKPFYLKYVLYVVYLR